MTITYDPYALYVNRADLDGPVTPDQNTVVWNAQRPLNGEHMWEGRNRWGIFYASSDRDNPRYGWWASANMALDAKAVQPVTNRRVVALYRDAIRAHGGRPLEDYLDAGVDIQEALQRFPNLPWSENDRTADHHLVFLQETRR